MGLWHLGSVTAACLASAGHHVFGYDANPKAVELLQRGQPPVSEPRLQELIASGLSSGKLAFTSEPAKAFASADLIWVAYDTPVDDQDHADVDFLMDQVRATFSLWPAEVVALISSQLPVGTTRRLEEEYRQASDGKGAHFAYSPENLRLGKALDAFFRPDRVVVGSRSPEARKRIAAVLAPITDHIEWMGIESAEMTKHALNAFLAASVAFMNEIAILCESVGADAKEVERGLKTESRIGPRAYLAPGAAFAGGTLARDVNFLVDAGRQAALSMPLLNSVGVSNELHNLWPRRKLREALGELAGRRIALLGLTYKPGTDTLRRSSAVELGRWLSGEQAVVAAFDPALEKLPAEIGPFIRLCRSHGEALRDSDAAVVCTEWPEFRELRAEDFVAVMRQPLVLDPNRFLASQIEPDARIQYATVGKSSLTTKTPRHKGTSAP
jgi:UDPglucose 6-dehydrogenase